MTKATHDYNIHIIYNIWDAQSEWQHNIVIIRTKLKSIKNNTIKLSISVLKNIKDHKGYGNHGCTNLAGKYSWRAISTLPTIGTYSINAGFSTSPLITKLRRNLTPKSLYHTLPYRHPILMQPLI